MQDALATFTGWYISYGYPILFLGVVLENAGVPVPGEAAVLAAGFLASPAGGARFSLGLIRRQFSLVLAERARLSREIHDTLLQSLAAIGVELETVLRQLDPREKAAVRTCRRLQFRARTNPRENLTIPPTRSGFAFARLGLGSGATNVARRRQPSGRISLARTSSPRSSAPHRTSGL